VSERNIVQVVQVVHRYRLEKEVEFLPGSASTAGRRVASLSFGCLIKRTDTSAWSTKMNFDD